MATTPHTAEQYSAIYVAMARNRGTGGPTNVTELAKVAGVSRWTLYRGLNGGGSFGLTTVRKVLQALPGLTYDAPTDTFSLEE